MSEEQQEILNEWDLFKDLEGKGYYLRLKENDTRSFEELKEGDIDWTKVGYSSAVEGYIYSDRLEGWLRPSSS